MEPAWSVVHIITRLELGGAQLATLYQAGHGQFAARPRFIIFGPGGLLDAEAQTLRDVRLLPAPSLVRQISPCKDAQALLEVRAHLLNIQAWHPQRRLLVHTHSSKAGIIGRWAARLAGAQRVVHSIHGFGHQPRYTSWASAQMLKFSEKVTAQITDGFTADSAANLRRGEAEGIITDQPRCVVRCGIDVTHFARPESGHAPLRAALQIPSDHAIILQIGCLKPQKDPLAVVRLAATLRERFPRVTYLIAGDGELRPSLEAACKALRLDDTVRLLGWRRDIPDLLELCDFLLLTSLWEGLPQVFFQAMAAGKAIVATCVDGAPEAIVDGVTGRLVPPHDPAALANATAAMLGDVQKRQRMGEAGKKRAGEFSQEVMVCDLEKFYARLISTAAS